MVEINKENLIEGINFDCSLCDAGKCPFGTLTSTPETSERTSVIRDVELGLPLELVLEVLEKSVVKVFAT
jgi:hypothetical protein